MKVNINIDEKILGKIDGIARREKRSRSQIIQLILENTLAAGLPNENKTAGAGKYDRFLGCWEGRESAEELILQMRESRAKNIRLKKVKL